MTIWRRKEQTIPDRTKRPDEKQYGVSGAKTRIGQRYGITTLYAPEKKIVADIVFVHGIRGDPEKTWTTPKGGNLWPRTLLPQAIPNARVMTFGYDSSAVSLRGTVSSSKIANHAKNLLSELARCRASEDEYYRPIIFVAHSMGGLICKDALLAARSSAEPHLQQILDTTWGILFLGTPHYGSGLAVWAERIATWAGLLKQTNPDVVGVLRQDSELLARIQDDFHSMLRARIDEGYQRISITCFYEELPLAGVGEIVPHSSAVIPGYPSIGIHADHREMARFSSSDDPGYKSIVGELQRWINDITRNLTIVADSSPLDVPLPHSTPNPAGSGNAEVADKIALGNVSIWGDVKQSNIVGGNQTIVGGLTFGD